MPNRTEPATEDYVSFIQNELNNEFPEVFPFIEAGGVPLFRTFVSQSYKGDRREIDLFNSAVQNANRKWFLLHP